MADPVLKFPPEQKGAPGQPPREKVAAAPRRRLLAGLRRYRRFLLLVVLPIVAVVGGVVFYLSGGRYVGTDDTYVGAQKVLITPDISGRIDKVVVKEGQLVHKGDVLFEIDPIPFRLAVDRSKAAVEQAKTSYSNLIANIKIYDQMAELMQQAIDLKQRDVDRKSALVKNSYGSQLDLDNSTNSAITVRAELAFVQQQRSSSLTQLLGNPNLKLDDFPPYYQAQAVLAQAQRDLDHSEMRAPMDGIATLVDQIQLGRFVMAGSPVFTIIDVAKPWVEFELERIRLHPRRGGAGGRNRGRCFPRSHVQGYGRFALPRHRRAICNPAAAKRHRQFRQGGAAHSGADLFRSKRSIR